MKDITPICPYCGEFSKLVGGDSIYPHRPDLNRKQFYQCKPCDAYVGCHGGSDKPLGRLANKELREAKKAAHSAFDPIWQNGKKSRAGAYKWLARKLGIDAGDCHIGMFDVEMCNKVVQLVRGEL